MTCSQTYKTGRLVQDAPDVLAEGQSSGQTGPFEREAAGPPHRAGVINVVDMREDGLEQLGRGAQLDREADHGEGCVCWLVRDSAQ